MGTSEFLAVEMWVYWVIGVLNTGEWKVDLTSYNGNYPNKPRPPDRLPDPPDPPKFDNGDGGCLLWILFLLWLYYWLSDPMNFR